MNDRLGDIGDIPSWAAEPDEEDDNEVDLEKGKKKKKTGENFSDEPPQPDYMAHFFRDVDAIKADIDMIKKATKRIGQINEEAMMAMSTAEEKKLSEELRPIVDETNKRAKRTKTMLGLLKEETDKLAAEKTLKAGDLRIRENLNTTVTRKFIDEMKLYQNAQQKYKTDIKKKLTRQIQVVKKDATPEEIDAVMKSEGGRDALYQQTILAGGVADSVKTAYAKVAGKYQDVLTLEQSVAELHQMFLDFALLTEQQGELLDHIEFQVKNAADYVEEANLDIHESIEIQKKIRGKQMWIMLIVVIVVVVILFATGILP